MVLLYITSCNEGTSRKTHLNISRVKEVNKILPFVAKCRNMYSYTPSITKQMVQNSNRQSFCKQLNWHFMKIRHHHPLVYLRRESSGYGWLGRGGGGGVFVLDRMPEEWSLGSCLFWISCPRSEFRVWVISARKPNGYYFKEIASPEVLERGIKSFADWRRN
jgi:hypothetical protein